MDNILIDQNGFPSPAFRVLDEDGNILDQDWMIEDEKLLDFYQWMIKIRIADDKLNKLQRVGRMGTYASVYGQEACQVGAGKALTKSDWLVPTFRESGMMWCFGVPLENIYLYWKGNELGSKMPEDINCLPIAIPVGSHLPHATGIAWANKLKQTKSAVLCSFGDGASSTGDFHAALNFAGVIKTPVVFLCQNNQYAISTSRTDQTSSATIAQKGFAYGMKSVLVDGNDVVAMYQACKTALGYARENYAPVLIEAQTYRLGEHTTSDNSKLYRDTKEVDKYILKDPLTRVKKYLVSKKIWAEDKEDIFRDMVKEDIEEISDRVLNTPKLTGSNMFDMIYSELTPNLETQKKQFLIDN